MTQPPKAPGGANLNALTSMAHDPGEDLPSLFDKVQERSLYNLLSPKWQVAIDKIPEKYLTMSEGHLRRAAAPTAIDNMIRISFWQEYVRAQNTRSKMSNGNIIMGVTYQDYLYFQILENPKLCAWVLRPPQDLVISQKEALMEQIRLMREMLTRFADNADLLYTVTERKNKEGKVISVERKLNVPALGEMRKIGESLAMRVQGAILQKVAIDERKTFRVGAPEPGAMLPETSGSDIDDLKRMNTELKKMNKLLGTTEEVLDAEVSQEAGSGGGGTISSDESGGDQPE